MTKSESQIFSRLQYFHYIVHVRKVKKHTSKFNVLMLRNDFRNVSQMARCKKKQHKLVFSKMTNKHFERLHSKMQKTRNNCFGWKKRIHFTKKSLRFTHTYVLRKNVYFYTTRAYLFLNDEGSCYFFSTRNNCCEFLAC